MIDPTTHHTVSKHSTTELHPTPFDLIMNNQSNNPSHNEQTLHHRATSHSLWPNHDWSIQRPITQWANTTTELHLTPFDLIMIDPTTHHTVSKHYHRATSHSLWPKHDRFHDPSHSEQTLYHRATSHSLWPNHDRSIQQPITQWANTTTELHLTPFDLIMIDPTTHHTVSKYYHRATSHSLWPNHDRFHDPLYSEHTLYHRATSHSLWPKRFYNHRIRIHLDYMSQGSQVWHPIDDMLIKYAKIQLVQYLNKIIL